MLWLEDTVTRAGLTATRRAEICEDMPYNTKSDVWGLGCILYEMAALKRAFEGKSLPALVTKILRGRVPPIPSRYSMQIRSLIQSMLARSPSRRPSVESILKLPWMRLYLERYAAHMRRHAVPPALSPAGSASPEPARASSPAAAVRRAAKGGAEARSAAAQHPRSSGAKSTSRSMLSPSGSESTASTACAHSARKAPTPPRQSPAPLSKADSAQSARLRLKPSVPRFPRSGACAASAKSPEEPKQHARRDAADSLQSPGRPDAPQLAGWSPRSPYRMNQRQPNPAGRQTPRKEAPRDSSVVTTHAPKRPQQCEPLRQERKSAREQLDKGAPPAGAAQRDASAANTADWRL